MYHRGRPTSREMTVKMCSGGYLFSKKDHYLLTRERTREKEREGKKGLNEEQAAAANADDRKREKGGREWDGEKVKKDESEKRIENERGSDEWEKERRNVWFTQQVIKSDVLGDRTLRRNDFSGFFFQNKLLIIPL